MKRPVLCPGERLELIDYASGPLYRIDVVGEDGARRSVGWGPYMGAAPQWAAAHAPTGGVDYLLSMRVAYYRQHGYRNTARAPNPVEVFGATAA